MVPRRPWIAAGVVLLALAAAAVAARWADGRRAQWFAAELARARADREAGRPASALRRLKGLEAAAPGRGEVTVEVALCELARGREGAALNALNRVGPDSPAFGAAAARRADLAIRRGRLAEAEGLLDDSLRQPGPHRAGARDALVRLLRSEGRTAEARRLFLAGFAEAADPVAALRRLYHLDTDPLAAEGLRRYLDNAARQAPDDDRAWLGRAHLATWLGRLDEAERLLADCRRRRPTDPAVGRAWLDWALAADRPDAARSALALIPADESARRRLPELRAWLAARRGDRDAERAALEDWLRLDPAATRALDRLAALTAADGRDADAAKFRGRRAAIESARSAYERGLAARDALRRAAELARLADALGRRFDAAVWSALARPGAKMPGPEPDQNGTTTLADLLPEIKAPMRATASAPAANGDGVRFVDDAEIAGLRFVHDSGAAPGRLIPPVTASGGVGLLDYDGDGWLDAYGVQGGPFPPDPGTVRDGDRLFRNRGDGTFEDATESAGIAALPRGYGHGVAAGDIDNDGRPDLFVTRWRHYALLRNRGDGTFEDITDRWGLGGDRDWPTSAAFADLDGDGDLDLYVCHYLRWDEGETRPCADPKDPTRYNCNPRDFPARPDHLFRNDGDRFTDVTAEAGIRDRDGRGLGVVAADLDEDGRIDLFVANDTTANYLFINQGGFRFEERAHEAGVAANADGGYQAGMGVACGDLDGDGRPDLVVTNFFGEGTSLFGNLGRGAFVDRSAAAGLAAATRHLLGFGAALLDADNDGRPDLLTANGHVHDGRPQFPFLMPAQLLLGGPNGRFVDASARAGEPFDRPHLGRGLAAGDLDNDGRVDALLVAQGEPLVYLHNRSRAGRWLTIALEGTASNRDAVGASVAVEAGGRRQVAWRLGGGSYQSSGDPRLHFGLGGAEKAERLTVRWPSGRINIHENLDAGAGYRLREGDPAPRPLPGARAGEGGR